MDFSLRIPVKVSGDPDSENTELPPSRRFWQPYSDFIAKKIDEKREGESQVAPLEVDPRYMEISLKRGLPRALSYSLVSRLEIPESDIRESNIPPEHLARLLAAREVLVNIGGFKYSSLEFEIFLEPATKVIEAFEGNFDYFEAFLRQYLPEAFVAGVEESRTGGIYTYNDEKDFLRRHYSHFELEMRQARQAFSEYRFPSRTQEAASSSPLNKARWAWITANTSLVLPALIIAVFAYVWMSDRQSAIDAAYKDLINVQMQLVRSFVEKEDHSKPSGTESQTKTKP